MPDKEMTRAGFGPRAAAYIIDRAIVFAALCVVRLPFGIAALFGAGGLTAKDFLFDHSFLDVLCWVLMSAYFVLLTWFGGSTLGKKVMRLRVCRADGEPMRFIDVLYRETVGRFLSGILCLGYFMVLVDKEQRGFHDWLCGTAVVYENDVNVAERKRKDPAASAWTPVGGSAAQEHPAPEARASSLLGYTLPGETPVPAPEAPAFPETPAVPETPETEPVPAEPTFPAAEEISAPEEEN